MNAQDQASHENNFAKNLTNVNGIKYTILKTEPISNGNSIVKIRPPYSDYYYSTKTNKTKIVLHSTIGVLRSDLAALSVAGQKMSVSYVIARNGTIYELFDPEYWSYHIGRGCVGGNEFTSKQSIGIELSNYGPLKLVNGNLETMYSNVSYRDANNKLVKSKKDIYCSTSDTQYYKYISPAFRDYNYFASYTDAQYKSVKDLIDHLSTKFNIPKNYLDETKRYETFGSDKEAQDYTGVCSHINFRSSGKWDIGPDFDWYVVMDNQDMALPVAEPPVNALPAPVAPINALPTSVAPPIKEQAKPVINRPFDVPKPKLLDIILKTGKSIASRFW